jgi:hypothetical protein
MIVNFKTSEISRDAYKLAQIPILFFSKKNWLSKRDRLAANRILMFQSENGGFGSNQNHQRH